MQASNRGFTLVELLLYVATAALILTAAVTLFAMVLGGRVKNQAVAEVEQQGAIAMQTVLSHIRNARGIDMPLQGIATATLVLDTMASSTDPVVVDIVSGTIRLVSGTGLPVALTNNRVIVSDLVFENFSAGAAFGTVRVRFTLTHVNPQQRGEFEWSKMFEGSAAVRHP